MAQVGEFATPAAVPLPHRFKRKGRRSRRIRPVKPVAVQVYENPQRTVIDYRMARYGLTEDQAKSEWAGCEYGRLWLKGQISREQRDAAEKYLELHDEMLRAIKAPVGLRKTNLSGDGGDLTTDEYIVWAIGAVAKWKVFEMKGWPCLPHVIIADRPVGGMLDELRMALTILAKRFGIVAQLAVAT